ncbi:MAG TPA: protein-L-isoaspartate(D-aspartate) O-methyltransferase [Flavilitoribacter sp.]|nr:protein-L-isoaspartate(D-aspartate) O-methyltransferase [Flavilitoribacter sp.]
MEDTYRHKGMRRKLIGELRIKGIRDEKTLAAMEALPRHYFLEKAFEEWAYSDKPFPIGEGQTISQPYTVAYQTSLLEVEKRMKVLEVGTGSGYQSAVLALLGARVYTVERFEPLFLKAKAMLEALGLKGVRCFHRDGYKGLPEFAPFDRILVTAGAPEIPENLLKQLTIGGMMVIPVGEKVQKMYRITRLSETEFREETFHDFQFVPFLPGLK